MAELATLARPYANAAFEIAKSSERLDQWSRALSMLAAVASFPEIKSVIESPVVTDAQKAHQLCELLRDDLSDAMRRFVVVLAENKRIRLLEEIADQFETRRAEELRTLDVEVSTAVPLSEAQRQKFEEALARRFDQEINLTTSVDADLIGGALIRAGDTVIDGTIKGKLEKLGEALRAS